MPFQSFRQQQRLVDQTAREGFFSGVPTTFGENAEAAAARFIREELSVSRYRALGPRFDEQIQKAKDIAGVGGLDNPITVFGSLDADKHRHRWNLTIRSLKEQFPDAGFQDWDEILDETKAEFGEKREHEDDVFQRATTGGDVGRFVGGMAGAFVDPINLATLPLGAGASTSIAKTMLIEAAVAGASEFAIQQGLEGFHEEIGVEHNTAQNVLYAAGGGALFSGLIKGAVKGYEHLTRPEIVKKIAGMSDTELLDALEKAGADPRSDLMKAARREAEINASLPEGGDLAEHRAKLTAEYERIHESGRAGTFDGEPTPLTRGVSPERVEALPEVEFGGEIDPIRALNTLDEGLELDVSAADFGRETLTVKELKEELSARQTLVSAVKECAS